MPRYLSEGKFHNSVKPKFHCLEGSVREDEFLVQPAIYILASAPNGTLYIGVTSNLVQRVWQHRNDFVDGFASKYRVHLLVHYELTDNMVAAIQREKQLKKWNRSWNLKVVEKSNPTWRDLWPDLLG